MAVLDIALPDGLDAIRGLNDRQLVDIVVVLTDRTDGASVMEALRAGVEGYLVKSSALPTVGKQIQRVLSGERVISPEVQRIAVSELGAFARMAREGSEVRASLTPREHEVLMLLSRGLTMRQMATRWASRHGPSRLTWPSSTVSSTSVRASRRSPARSRWG